MLFEQFDAQGPDQRTPREFPRYAYVGGAECETALWPVAAAPNTWTWAAAAVPPGTYFVRVTVGDRSAVWTVALVR